MRQPNHYSKPTYDNEERERNRAELILKGMHNKKTVEDMAKFFDVSVLTIYSAMNRYDKLGEPTKCSIFSIRKIIEKGV